MSLRNVYAKPSGVGQNLLELVHREKQEVLDTLMLENATKEHRSFILATWVRSYIHNAKLLGVSKSLYTQEEPSIAEKLWQTCKVLVTPEDHFTVHAWVAGKPGRLFHCYVVPELRGCGVAKSIITMACGGSPELAKPWPFESRWTYNPYLYVKELTGV